MKVLVGVALIVVGSSALAGPVSWSPGPLGLPIIENFEGFGPIDPVLGNEFLGPERIAHGWMSGAFQGQTSTVQEPVPPDDSFDYEQMTGNPTDPLTLVGQGARQNVVLQDFGVGPNTVASGLLNSYPQGVLSLLFDVDQTSFGMNVLGIDLTTSKLFVTFFDRNGTVIDDLTIDIGDPGSCLLCLAFSFTSTRAFAGVNLSSNDQFGAAFDNLRYQIPEPATGALLVIGLLGLGLGRRGWSKPWRWSGSVG